MGSADQHNACRLGKLRVEPDHVNCEGDFVGYSLSRRLNFGPEFKVFEFVICALTIFVVNIFVWQQTTTKKLFHDKSVFEGFSALYAMFVRESNSYIALARDMALSFSRFSGPKSLMFSNFISATASGTTQLLLTVDGSSGSSLYRHWLATLNAIYLPFLIGKLAPLASASARTVKRVSSMFFTVAVEFPRASHEWVATLFASESYSSNSLNSAVMRVIAVRGTKLSILGRSAFKRFLAVQTIFHDAYSFVNEYFYHTHYGTATAEGIY